MSQASLLSFWWNGWSTWKTPQLQWGPSSCEFRPRVAELGPKETSQESEPLASFCCVVWLPLVRRLPWMDGRV